MSGNGILNISKPESISSFAVVARLKRLTREKHVGHTGTLDPIATGVLPVCFGQATRVARFITDFSKSYIAQIELGTITDTFDREGTIIERNNPGNIAKDAILHVISLFQGVIMQVPPQYSALKHQGRRYYELARAGIAIEPKPRQVEIHHIELIDYQLPLITIKVECGKGTYIRSLAHDVGMLLGCGAFLKELVRITCGPFSLEDSLSMNEVEDACARGVWMEMLHPVDSPLSHLQAITVDEKDEKLLRNGCSVGFEGIHLVQNEYCRAYDSRGNFIGILRYLSNKKCWHPDRVFSL